MENMKELILFNIGAKYERAQDIAMRIGKPLPATIAWCNKLASEGAIDKAIVKGYTCFKRKAF